jgi:hypothetical protein
MTRTCWCGPGRGCAEHRSRGGGNGETRECRAAREVGRNALLGAGPRLAGEKVDSADDRRDEHGEQHENKHSGDGQVRQDCSHFSARRYVWDKLWYLIIRASGVESLGSSQNVPTPPQCSHVLNQTNLRRVLVFRRQIMRHRIATAGEGCPAR